MKRSSWITGLASTSGLLLCSPWAAPVALAHHSFAMFDRSQTRTITGTVKEFQLINPHGWLRLMVADAHGNQNEWSLELGGVGQQERGGWSPSVVHPGDRVVAQLHPLRDGSYGGQLISVTLPDGKVLGRAF
jgi:hypothetical protein